MENVERNLIKKAFYKYPENQKTVVISTVDWAESNFAVNYEKLCVQTSPCNQKETQLCALLDKNNNLIRWCYLVEKVLEHYHFEKDKVKFINMHFFKQKGDIETCLEVGICRATFYNWQEEILETAYNWAKELKLIGVTK